MDDERVPWLDYADRTTIVVAFGDIYTDRFDEQTVFTVVGDPPWTQRWLAQRVLSTARINEDGSAVSHDLKVTSTYHSWGASGVGHELVLKLAEYSASGVVGAVATTAVRSLFDELVERMRRADQGYPRRSTIDADEARSRAQWMVESRYQRDADSLKVAVEEEDRVRGEWRIVVRDDTDEFTVSMQLLDELAVVTRLRRESLT